MGLDSAAETAPLSTMASAMFFGTIIFATIAFATQSFLTGDYRALKLSQNPRSKPLDMMNVASIYTLLHHFSVFGFLLFYAYICEYHPPYPHADKSYDRDMFFFLTALLFIVSFFTMKKHEKGKVTAAISKDDASNKKELLDTKKTSSDKNLNVDLASPPPTAVSTAVKEVEKPNDATEVLNRDQTEEWKGWMQFMFLLYHYYHAEEVYNSIRIMITCYVWMTGFGNFSFFYIKGDYGSVRVMQMLWRLNFLVIFLVFTQGTTYILYYICLLHTYYFCMVYVVMRIGNKQLNYSKWGVRQKLAILAIFIYLVWDTDLGLFRLIHYPFLGEYEMLGAGAGAMWEWYFRSSLDHWSTFLGMLFALNFPITSLWFRKLEALPIGTQIAAKGSVGVVLFACFVWWVQNPFQQGKFDYNQTNAYWGFIPLITYIYFRNMTRWLRGHTMELLHQIGKTTLETYLMQHHIWLTSNAKSLLTLIPGWPKMNFLLVTIIYVVVSRRLYTLTLFLRGMLLPDDIRKCYTNIIVLGAIMLSYVGLAHVLNAFGMLDLPTVAVVSISLGLLLYQIILEKTSNGLNIFRLGTFIPGASRAITGINDGGAPVANGTSNGKAVSPSSNGSSGSESHLHSNSNPEQAAQKKLNYVTTSILGAAVILFMGVVWNTMANIGATKIIPLPESCSEYANTGVWVPIDGCNEESRGNTYRNYGITRLATTCSDASPTYAWGWNISKTDLVMKSQCRFKHRDPKTLKTTLKHRNLLFIGDSESRNVYHSFARQLGDKTAGAYNTSLPKQADMYNDKIQGVNLQFLWKPYLKEQNEFLKQLLTNAKNKQLQLKSSGSPYTKDQDDIDVILMGGGSWDRLHNYNTKPEQDEFNNEMELLKSNIDKIQMAGFPVTWMVPTTISTDALKSEEKRTNIDEQHMNEVRQMYQDHGILDTAAFVLDGTAFTADRTFESFDGVHYPHTVYDAGAQIYANAMDWLLQEDKDTSDPFKAPKPGPMAHPKLGLLMLVFAAIALFGMDGFCGALTVAAIFVPSVKPTALFDEAFTCLHKRLKLPLPMDENASVLNYIVSVISGNPMKGSKGLGGSGGMTSSKSKSSDICPSEQKETVSLLDNLEDPHHTENGKHK